MSHLSVVRLSGKDFTSIPVGPDRVAQPVARTRTDAQRATAARLVARPEFAFACDNPFTPDAPVYSGSFTLTWYDTRGWLHATRIGRRGEIVRELVVG